MWNKRRSLQSANDFFSHPWMWSLIHICLQGPLYHSYASKYWHATVIDRVTHLCNRKWAHEFKMKWKDQMPHITICLEHTFLSVCRSRVFFWVFVHSVHSLQVHSVRSKNVYILQQIYSNDDSLLLAIQWSVYFISLRVANCTIANSK